MTKIATDVAHLTRDLDTSMTQSFNNHQQQLAQRAISYKHIQNVRKSLTFTGFEHHLNRLLSKLISSVVCDKQLNCSVNISN